MATTTIVKQYKVYMGGIGGDLENIGKMVTVGYRNGFFVQPRCFSRAKNLRCSYAQDFLVRFLPCFLPEIFGVMILPYFFARDF
jgi:hypothetical protein